MKFHNRSMFEIFALVVLIVIITTGVAPGCSKGGTDPAGALLEVTGMEASGLSPSLNGDRVVWGGYFLEFKLEESTVDVIPWDRGIEAHFNVTSMVLKPACTNCLRLENFSYDKSAGIIDLDAVLINPTVMGGYDVRAVLLLNEWDTGRRLLNEEGLTDYWSGDMYHPDPYFIFAKESDERYFGPAEEHSAHVQILFPTPANLIVPFIVDASYPGHSIEPTEINNVTVEGSIHPTGYALTVTLDLLDWQNDAKGVYLDCTTLNPLAGLQVFYPEASGAAGETFETWVLNLQYDARDENAWLPQALGEFELPIVALDSISTAKIYRRITVEVTLDTEPPEWTGEVGIDEVWWGSQRAIVSFYPATDPSGPVIYNIHATTEIPLIPPTTHVATGWSHYAAETVDGAEYTFCVTAEDQAGNECLNDNEESGICTAITLNWEQVFSADLESNPNVKDINSDMVQDVIFGCDNGMVYSLHGDTGVIQWSYQTGGMVKSSAAIRDVNDDAMIDVLIGSNDTFIHAINLVFGEPYAMMTFATSNLVESSPVCADQTGDGIPEVVAGSFDNNLYAFEGGTGDLLVSYDTTAPVKATPSLEDFNGDGHLDVLIASGGRLRAINGISGASIWTHNFGTGFSLGSPAIGDLNGDSIGDVVAGSNDGVYAFDVANGAMLWSNEDLTGNFDTSPALGDVNDDDVPDVAISSRYIGVVLLDGNDGSVIWESEDEIYMPTSPVLADMNEDEIVDVIVGSADYYLRIINGVDGISLYKWSTSPYGAVTTIPLVADVNSDGNIDVVYATENNYMFSITTNLEFPDDLELLPWPKFMRTRSNTGNLAHPLN